MSFLIVLGYALSILGLVIVWHNKEFRQRIGVRTRGDFLSRIIVSVFPGFNWIWVLVCFAEYFPYAYPTICEALKEALDLDKEL